MRVNFTVSTCDGVPVPDVTEDDFEVINDETGEPFQSEGGSSAFVEAMNFEFYTILVLDLSNSIVENGRLDDVLDGAQMFVQGLVENQTGNFRHSVAIFAFGSTEASALEQDFTDDALTLYDTINGLRADPGRGSTNLYGAFTAGLDQLAVHGAGDLVSRNLVIFTDGTHETGDKEEMRAYALTRLEESDVSSYAIGIKGDYSASEVEELASNPDNFILVEDSGDLVDAFEQVSGMIDAWSRSNYVMGVCSPLEGPDRSLTIRITRGSDYGELQVGYSAVGFNLVGCDAQLVALGQGCDGYVEPGNTPPRLSNGFWREAEAGHPFTHQLVWSICDEDDDLSGGQVFTWLSGTHVPFFGDFEIFFDDFTGGAPSAPDCDNPLEIDGIPVDFTGLENITLCADVEVTDGDGHLSNKIVDICIDL